MTAEENESNVEGIRYVEKNVGILYSAPVGLFKREKLDE